MAAPNPIQGITSMNVGSTTTFTSSTIGGIWSSSDTGICTIVAGTGIATSVSSGDCQIIYTVGSDSTALNLSVLAQYSLTNGLNFNECYNALKNRVLWKSQGIASDSQRYYEDFHKLNNTELLDVLRPKNGLTLQQYLDNEQRAIIFQCLNAVYNASQVLDHAKLAFYRLAGNQLPLQLVANNNQFVGLRLNIGRGDRSIKLNSLQLWFTKAGSMNLYLFNDMINAPVMTIPVTWTANQQTVINLGEKVILSNLVPTAYKQGTWYFGYFQADLIGGSNNPLTQAVYYPVNYSRFHSCSVLAFSANLTNDGSFFLRNNIGANNLMYGMNLEISSFIDATNNIVQNAHLFDELIGNIMAVKSVDANIFNYQTGAIQRAIGSVIEISKLYAELNGYKASEWEPYIMGLKDKVNRSIRTVKAGMQKDKSLFIGS